jgi:DNA-binding NtrC family response regulator
MKSLVRKTLAATEREVVVEALRLSGGNKSRAARLLQVDSKTLRAKVKEYDLNHIQRSETNEQE